MNRPLNVCLTLLLVATVSSVALAEYEITQPASINTYSTTLNFDEPGTPTGIISTDAFASLGLADLGSERATRSLGTLAFS